MSSLSLARSLKQASLKYQLQPSTKLLHGLLILNRPSLTRQRPRDVIRVARCISQVSGRRTLEESPSRNFQGCSSQQQSVVGTQGLRCLSLSRLKKRSPLCIRAFDESGKSSFPANDADSEQKKASGNFFKILVRRLLKIFGGAFVAAILLAAALPSLLSWSPGRKTALSFANKSIPGTIGVKVLKLGWMRPVLVEGFFLEGTDGEKVISIPKVETKARLWLIALGKSGLGDCTVTSPVIDLQQHPNNNLPRVALALQSEEKLLKDSKRPDKQVNQVQLPPAELSLVVSVKAPKGGLEVTGGKVIFPSDVASILGDRLVFEASLGPWAIDKSDTLKAVEDKGSGEPLLASFWSETVQAEVVGFFQSKNSKLKLLQPARVEMDLTPAVAKGYLARVNPLLGEIVGPAIQDEDMPDVVIQLTPENLEVPAEHYKINIAPMKVTIARGQVVDGVLSLLSRQDIAKNTRNLTMQTSAIEANVDMPSTVRSSRLDVLIAGKVHVATWGSLDWVDETVKMTMAIPGDTLINVMGLTKTPPTYFLQFPVGGTLDKLVVDWKKAGLGIAELTARQRGGQFMKGIFDIFESNTKKPTSTVPEPIEALPWENPEGK